MKKFTFSFATILCLASLFIFSCGNDDPKPEPNPEPENQAPTVEFTNPPKGISYVLSSGTDSTFALRASANDPDGSITKVELFIDGTKIREDFTSPYEADFNFKGDKAYTLKAIAFDNEGASTTITLGTTPLLLP